jgi:hypothetical protein
MGDGAWNIIFIIKKNRFKGNFSEKLKVKKPCTSSQAACVMKLQPATAKPTH